MKSLSKNSPCPCGSGLKYKKCCRPYHLGKRPTDALALMKSRYSAYAAGEADYIIETTHPDNPEFDPDRKRWKKSVLTFSRTMEFLGLEILENLPGDDESIVTFRANLSGSFHTERSRFRKVDGRWLYLSGEFLPDTSSHL